MDASNTIPAIPLPSTFDVKVIDDHRSEIVISPLYPGYGTTVGNALRRVLFSSLPGAAVTTIKVKNVSHEFSSIPGVKEDVVELIMNIKQLRLRLHGTESQTVVLKAKGEGKATAKDITAPTQVDIVDPKHHIATLTQKDASLEIEMVVSAGRGYVPVETREKEQREIGSIAIDALYTPIRTVTYKTENVRVEQMTNWDKLTLDIETDGTIEPIEALQHAVQILSDHFEKIGSFVSGGSMPAEAVADDAVGQDA